MRTSSFVLAIVLVSSLSSPALAHVGNPDVVYEGAAGPYRLLVSVRPPDVIPGVAEVEVHSADADVRTLELVPMPLTGDGAKFAPTPDKARPVEGAPQSFVARLWMMSAGSWQVRIHANGDRGPGDLAVPVPALPSRGREMQRWLGLLLVAMLALLTLGVVSIVGASLREAQLPPEVEPDAPRRRRALIAMVVTGLVVVAIVWGGRVWWDAEATQYARYVYKPIQMSATVEPTGLVMTLRDPGWLKTRRLDDLVPDHDHLVHLFVVRVPALDRLWHLHPTAMPGDRFVTPLPPELPAGRYQLFADVVHATGLAETAVAELDLPAASTLPSGAPLNADDAAGSAPPFATADATRRESPLDGGGRVVWEHDATPIVAGHVDWLRFRVEDADGKPTPDLELYMGMLGHAAVMRDDRSVFAHLHPTGSVPMASMTVVTGGDPHAGHHAAATGLPSTIGFPFSFPKRGPYRIFMQFKRRGRIETTAFDTIVK